MRTALDIDDELMARAMQTTGLTSRAAVIEAALRRLVSAVPGPRTASSSEDFHHRGSAEWRPAADVTNALGRQAELDIFGAAMGFAKG